MKLAFILVLTASTSAFAGLDGRYVCANRPGLPDNTYSIQMTSIGDVGSKIPYVVAERYYRENSNDPSAPVKKSVLSGLAVVSESESDKLLMLGALKLEIVDEAIKGCKRTN